MPSNAVQPRHTPEEYLALERKAGYKSEYVNGQVIAMAGASRLHNLIAGNLYREVSQQLRGRPCEAYISDMRLKVSRTGLYTYPVSWWSVARSASKTRTTTPCSTQP
jgi:Uma2 family endonuclease